MAQLIEVVGVAGAVGDAVRHRGAGEVSSSEISSSEISGIELGDIQARSGEVGTP